MKKRIFAVLLSCLLLIPGCTNQNQGRSNDESEETVSSETIVMEIGSTFEVFKAAYNRTFIESDGFEVSGNYPDAKDVGMTVRMCKNKSGRDAEFFIRNGEKSLSIIMTEQEGLPSYMYLDMHLVDKEGDETRIKNKADITADASEKGASESMLGELNLNLDNAVLEDEESSKYSVKKNNDGWYVVTEKETDDVYMTCEIKNGLIQNIKMEEGEENLEREVIYAVKTEGVSISIDEEAYEEVSGDEIAMSMFAAILAVTMSDEEIGEINFNWESE